jgi:hypothetical protein
MITRRLFVSGLFDIEHRTDGWYFTQLQSEDGWNGPHRNVGAIVEAIANVMEEQIRTFYQLRYRELPS